MVITASAVISRFPFYVFIIEVLLIGCLSVSVSATVAVPHDPLAGPFQGHRPLFPRVQSSNVPSPLPPLSPPAAGGLHTESGADDPLGPDLAILALPTGVLYATHIFGVSAADPLSFTAVNTGDFLYGAYGRRAFPTTSVAVAFNGTDFAPPPAGPLLGPSCADVSSLRYYTPSTAFLFPVPRPQQRPTRGGGGPPPDVGGPRAIINGSCRLPSSRGWDSPASLPTAAAPIVVSLRDRPGALPLSLQGPVTSVFGTVAASVSASTGVEGALLSERRWWAVRDLSALRAAMPSPSPPEGVAAPSAAQHSLTLVAAFAQATADGNAPDASTSFPVSAYGRTCLWRAGVGTNTGAAECEGQAVYGAAAVPVYALTGLVLAYADADQNGTASTTSTTVVAATVFIGGMPYSTSSSSIQPVAPVLFFSASKLSGTDETANKLAMGFIANPSTSVLLPSAAYNNAAAPTLNVIPNNTNTCPRTMADSIAPRWAWAASADFVYASSCAAFIAAGNFVSLTGMSPTNGLDFGLWLSDYLLLTIQPPAGSVNSDPLCGHLPHATNTSATTSNSSCPRWPSPFPLVGDTLSFNDQGPPPLDQTFFLTNEEAWCAFSQYIAAAPTGSTMGVSFLCSADRKTVFVVTCGGDRFSWDQDVDFDAPSQSPPAAAPFWSALWASLLHGDGNTNRTRPPYYACLGGVPLMAFDAINDPSGFRFHCSACTTFIEAGEAPLPYAAVAIAALKDALLIALAVWIMSFPRLQNAASAVVAWLSALVVPFSDPALARRLNRAIAETLRRGDEVTATELAQTARTLAAFGAQSDGQGTRTPSQEESQRERTTYSRGCDDGRPGIIPSAPHDSSPTDLFTARSFEAFLLYYVLRGCQRTVSVARLEQWVACPPPPSVGSVHAEVNAARLYAALEITHHLRAMRLAWASLPLERLVSPRDNDTTTDDGSVDPSPPLSPVHIGDETTRPDDCSTASEDDPMLRNDSRAALYAATRALWASLDGHGLLVPVTFADTAIDHSITPPVWLMLLHLLFCVIYMIIILVTVVRSHSLPCRNPQDSDNGEGHTMCMLSSGWHVYQAIFFRYINSTTSVSLIVNGIIRVLYLPPPPPALDGCATFFGPPDAALVLRACCEANHSVLGEDQTQPTSRNEHTTNGEHCAASSTAIPPECPREHDHLHTPLNLSSEEKLMNPIEDQEEMTQWSSLAADEAMVAVLRRGHQHNAGLFALVRRCLRDRFVQCGLLLPLPVLLTHAIVGAVLYVWVTIPVMGLLVLVAVTTHRAAAHLGQPIHPSLTGTPPNPVREGTGRSEELSSAATMTTTTKRRNEEEVENVKDQRGVLQREANVNETMPMAAATAADRHTEWLPKPTIPQHTRDGNSKAAPPPPPSNKQSTLCVVAARLLSRVIITFTCVLLCQTTVNWMVLAYTGGGGNLRLAYTFEAATNDLFAQVQWGGQTVPNTFLFKHRFPPPPALNHRLSTATAGTAAAVERLQDTQYVSYLGVLVREFEARNFACTFEMLAATVDGTMQTLSVLF